MSPAPFDDRQRADINAFNDKMNEPEKGRCAKDCRRKNKAKKCPSSICEDEKFYQHELSWALDGERKRIPSVCQMDERVRDNEPLRQAVERADPTAQS